MLSTRAAILSLNSLKLVHRNVHFGKYKTFNISSKLGSRSNNNLINSNSVRIRNHKTLKVPAISIPKSQRAWRTSNKLALRLFSTSSVKLSEKLTSTSSESGYPLMVAIGSVMKEVQQPKSPAFVPIKYFLPSSHTQTELGHLQWMLKKDLLRQDMFLIGPPGPMRRRLAMAFAELTSREVEYISLSRDTTESDMKQRREVIQKTAQYLDQAAVRAATEGRLLIIEGIEKAERNVLPLLNNLLENREMHLEDGRHLISHDRYEKLLKEHGQPVLDKWKLVKVDENFRVIALGLPVPFFKGNPLDPPLRSRFQGRSIVPLTAGEMLAKLKELAPKVPEDKLKTLNEFAYAVVWASDPDFRNSEADSSAIELPHFPIESLSDASTLLNSSPDISLYRLLVRLYPYDLIIDKEEGQLEAVNAILTQHGLNVEELASKSQDIKDKFSNWKYESDYFHYVPVQSHENVVAEMLESFGVKRDICLVGERGSGKSVMVSRFAELIGSKIEPIVMYKDMTARDLLQQRATKQDGDTVWRNSALVTAALEGKLAVLDGLDQVHSSTLAVIFRLVHDRELQLHNGTRLTRADRYDELKQKYNYTDEEMNELNQTYRIHPDFYIIATAAPPPPKASSGKEKKQWLTPEMLSLFFYHRLPQMSEQEEIEVIKSLCDGKSLSSDMKKIITTARQLRESKESSKKSLSSSLSTRQLVRIAKRTERFGSAGSELGPFEEVSRACLSRFLPPLNKEELESVMQKNGILPVVSRITQGKKVDRSNSTLTIGTTSAPICPDTEHKSKVPHVLFYDIQQHIQVLEELLQDYLMGEHLLLVGNQGVGKNKLVDQLLYLLNRPREYIQLHRDTTVQALTLQQKVVDGVVIIEDSPLVRAAREGHVIIIDEADKAPTHVTCILKTLAESGEMVLSDGRRIVPESVFQKHYQNLSAEEMNSIIRLHPDFRMFVLANRPGFPFLGNDFYSVLGDLFSVHAIDNPSFESEMELLKQYGPDIETSYLERIAKAFGDLRKMADEGSINYPYSTREAVNIIKHMRKFPQDTLSEAIDNVFDFDVYNSELRQTVRDTLKKYNLHPSEGVLLRSRTGSEGDLSVHKVSVSDLQKLQRDGDLKGMQGSGKNFQPEDFKAPKYGKEDPTGAAHVGGNTWAGGSGGMGTAGLGGAGGPYRLASGNPVFQVSDQVKEAVPPEVRKMAREMARKAFEEKLREIKMSKYEGNVYEEFLGPIRPQVQALRVILTSLQAKAKERKWVRHQTSGELDDAKIIEGVIGEKNVYKLRKDEEPEPGDPQQKPKLLKLVVDVSGSMYRFNGYDRRLDRVLECSLMLMESFKGFEDIFQYEIIGHSGDDFKLPLVSSKDVPKDNKERLDIMRIMHLHAQFCSSGDNTLEATQEAIKSLSTKIDDCDEAFVIVLSDANLERYGINPKELAKILNSNVDVKAFSVFIGSLGDQAQRLTEALPPGKAYVCLDTAQLPKILQRIFTQSILH